MDANAYNNGVPLLVQNVGVHWFYLKYLNVIKRLNKLFLGTTDTR